MLTLTLALGWLFFLPLIAAQSSSISSSTVTQSTASASSGPQTTTRVTVPIETYSFTPLPSPSVTGGVPTDPKSPPKVGSYEFPDFSAAWTTAWDKAKAMVATFSMEQKMNVTTGSGWQVGLCVGNVGPSNSSFPGLCLQDGPLGVRGADFITAFPTGVNAASTFNRELIRLRGLYIGREFTAKGVHIGLGPMMNLGRVAQAGRNWEGFGADPFLAGESAYETILGMQQGGTQACAKHLIGNEQENHRTMESTVIDDRTLHEVYAHPFLRSVQAGVTSMMCSYNLLNGTYACENDKIQNDILRREFGFQGYVMSDWGATHSTISAITGLDMTMPGGIGFIPGTGSYFGQNLTDYVRNGTIPEARLDDMATRIIAGWYFLGQDDTSFPTTNFNAFDINDDETNSHLDVQEDHYKLVRKMGAASAVLLKNTRNALPLDKPRTIVVMGEDAALGKIGPNQFEYQVGNEGILGMGWGSGSAWYPYLISPLEAIQRQARKDHTSLTWMLDNWNLEEAASMAPKKSAALVFINSNSGESFDYDGNVGDRKNLTAWRNGDELVKTVAGQNENTIVVVHSVGPLILEPWIEHPNVTAVVWAGVPGQEAGNAISDILYGDYNPSGRLPYTIAKKVEDYSGQLVTGGEEDDILYIPYTEALNIDYRHFDTNKIIPRYEFGYGLSYTNFEYSDLFIERTGDVDDLSAASWEAGGATEMTVGSSAAAWLHEPAFKVTFSVMNTGALDGEEIPQLYLNHPGSAGEPPSILKGFTNVAVAAGESEDVTIYLSRYDVSIWDVVAQGWRKPEGTIGVTVGASSRDSRLYGALP